MPAHTQYHDSKSTSLSSFSLMLLSGEATNTNLIVFGLTRSGLKPTIYRTRGEHANHYSTDVVNLVSGDYAVTVCMYWYHGFKYNSLTTIRFVSSLRNPGILSTMYLSFCILVLRQYEFVRCDILIFSTKLHLGILPLDTVI
jgi:hypothetical protein